MTDLITPIIIATFGGGMAVIIFGFFLLMRRDQRPDYENVDYAQRYAPRQEARSRYSYRSSAAPGTYRRDEDLEAAERENRSRQLRMRNLMIVILVVGIVAVAVSGFFFTEAALALLFLIFFLPIILQFIRLRRQGPDRENNPDRADDDRR